MAKSYLTYRRRAKSRHGVHSPFVYQLIENVIRNKDFIGREELKTLLKQLKNNRTKLRLTDLGAGPSSNRKNQSRSIASIAKTAAGPLKLSGMLQRLAVHLKAKNILELGTNLGITTAALAMAHTARNVISIEGDLQLAEIARTNLQQLELDAVVICGSFEEVLDKALNQLQHVDLAYIDGNHREEPTVKYFQNIKAFIKNDSVIAIGDIHWSPGMENAWNTIINDPDVRVSVDLFYVGLIFFKKELSREHFTIYHP